MKKLYCLCLVFISLSLSAQRIALVGAMPEEIRILTESLEHKEVVEKHGLTFYTGELAGKAVVVLKIGVGKVNAAYSTTVLLHEFEIEKVIFTGVAGGLHPESFPGDMVIGEEVFQHDYVKMLENETIVRATLNPEKEELNPLFFSCDSALVQMAKDAAQQLEFAMVADRKPRVFSGVIATGDAFVSNTAKAKQLNADFQALATEMEGAALGQICYQNQVPFLVIRSCSDNANNQAHLDFKTFMKPAAANAIQLVMGVLAKL